MGVLRMEGDFRAISGLGLSEGDERFHKVEIEMRLIGQGRASDRRMRVVFSPARNKGNDATLEGNWGLVKCSLTVNAIESAAPKVASRDPDREEATPYRFCFPGAVCSFWSFPSTLRMDLAQRKKWQKTQEMTARTSINHASPPLQVLIRCCLTPQDEWRRGVRNERYSSFYASIFAHRLVSFRKIGGPPAWCLSSSGAWAAGCSERRFIW